MNDKIGVIIPCGGTGKRLGLPYPKELLGIESNKVLIDYCFDLLVGYEDKVQVIVIINSEKLMTVRYLEKYRDKIDIVFCYQKSYEQELIGAIESARNLFLSKNIVLLPDTIIKLKNSQNIIEETIKLLDKNSLVFWVKKEKDFDILAQEGSLKIDYKLGQLIVEDYLDKPMKEIKELNSYWAAFAFNRESSHKCLYALNKIIQKDRNIKFKNSEFANSPGIEVVDSVDMGTWKSIYNYLRR
ncbi:hypothetical protein [Clostridium cibarium]|uniref:Glucose-1-phosphate thymidylyltransferase n=1 Tax=Clostridium cibarium TaxID=2762247 RepID=A0ABR8PY07_9CLOT|nr:hypothetical protein [Clostridium cibarium]MBD7913054.1 hypothetical protein [Clostridium cibarium]